MAGLGVSVQLERGRSRGWKVARVVFIAAGTVLGCCLLLSVAVLATT